MRTIWSPIWSVALPLSELTFALPDDLTLCGGEGRATLCGADGAPVVVMMGGISGDRFACVSGDGSPGWWSGLAATGRPIDPATHRVLGFDFAADEEGRFAPSTADQARVLAAALDVFGIERAALVIGASYGGMVALAFAELFPARVERLAVVSADASPHPYSTAGRELQRRVVRLGLEQGKGDEALAIARGMAMTSYRSREEFAGRFEGGIEGADPLTCRINSSRNGSESERTPRFASAAYPRAMAAGASWYFSKRGTGVR